MLLSQFHQIYQVRQVHKKHLIKQLRRFQIDKIFQTSIISIHILINHIIKERLSRSAKTYTLKTSYYLLSVSKTSSLSRVML